MEDWGSGMRTHDLRNRRLRYVTHSTGKHVTRRPSDLRILEALHRLGPQTTDALYQLLYPLYTSRRSLLYRLADLRNQENSDYSGPLLFYPDQQRRGATMPDNNHMVYDLLPRGEKLLKSARLYREHHPTTNGQEWKHDFMVGTIIASIAIAIKADPAHRTLLYPDQVLDELDGRRSFPVPEYTYTTQAGTQEIRQDALLRPDGLFAIKYAEGTKRIFPPRGGLPDGALSQRQSPAEKPQAHHSLVLCALSKSRHSAEVLWRSAGRGPECF